VVNMHSHEQKAQLSGSIRNTESIDLRRRNLDIADDIGIGTFYVAGVHGRRSVTIVRSIDDGRIGVGRSGVPALLH
jgi:hypothetical protein